MHWMNYHSGRTVQRLNSVLDKCMAVRPACVLCVYSTRFSWMTIEFASNSANNEFFVQVIKLMIPPITYSRAALASLSFIISQTRKVHSSLMPVVALSLTISFTLCVLGSKSPSLIRENDLYYIFKSIQKQKIAVVDVSFFHLAVCKHLYCSNAT